MEQVDSDLECLKAPKAGTGGGADDFRSAREREREMEADALCLRMHTTCDERDEGDEGDKGDDGGWG